MFPNEASNYKLGGQFAAVAGFVLDRASEKRLGRDLPPEWFAQHCCRDAQGSWSRMKIKVGGEYDVPAGFSTDRDQL